MSHGELTVVVEFDDVVVAIEELPTNDVNMMLIGSVGPPGPPGSAGQWVSLTQAEYDALLVIDPEVLYVIVE